MTLRKILTVFLVLAVMLTVASCGKDEGSTVTGRVVSLEGDVLTLREMEKGEGGGFHRGGMPEGFKGFNGEMPEGFEGFDGEMPEGFEGFDGEMPEGFEGFNGEMPEGFEGRIPQGGGGEREPMTGEMPDFESALDEGETREFNVANAHISVEIDGGKASGTKDDLTAGAFVTLMLNGKGEVTNITVSSSGFSGMGSFSGFGEMGGERPNFGGRGEKSEKEAAETTV